MLKAKEMKCPSAPKKCYLYAECYLYASMVIDFIAYLQKYKITYKA